METKKSNLVWGILLIVMGIIFLFGNISRIGMDYLWPVFLLAGGLIFILSHFKYKKNYGLLMPGSILTILGLLFLYCNFSGWWRMEMLWPVFILAPAVGFFAMYFGGNKDQGMLVPAFILSAVGIVFLFVSSGYSNFWPLFLIGAGILIILTQVRSDKKKEEDTSVQK